MYNEYVKIRWANNTRKYYESLGYKFTSYGEEFECRFVDIKHSSDIYADFTCDYCGISFTQQVKKYYRGSKIINKCSCNNCSTLKSKETKIARYGTLSPNIYEKTKEKRKISDKEKSLNNMNKVMKILNDKDYYIPPFVFRNSYDSIPYICKKHKDKGIKYITVGHAKDGRGCYYCGIDSMKNKQSLQFYEVKDRIESSGKNKLLSNNYINYSTINLKVSCETCGKPFVTSLAIYENGKTKCNYCSGAVSLGEKKIIDFLENNNIDYEAEKTIRTPLYNNWLFLDFYIPTNKICIEYDGMQHFKPVKFGGITEDEAIENLQNVQKRDSIKNKYCAENGIRMIRIPYSDIDNIENILREII